MTNLLLTDIVQHVASNSFTRYRPFPTPAQFAANPDLITRATIFVRRELRVWGCLDVEVSIAPTFLILEPETCADASFIVPHDLHHLSHEVFRYPF